MIAQLLVSIKPRRLWLRTVLSCKPKL